MKRIKLLGLLLIGLLIPGMVSAASGKISVSASNTVMLGNSVTVTVKLSSGSSIGSWQMDLNYDKSYLQLTKSDAESGGTSMANSSSSGTKSKSYSFTFKTLKAGSTKVSVGSYLAYDFNNMSNIDLSGGSTTINIKTKEQIEASYSDNANLKSLGVDGYEITPAFSKDVLEYELEVPNDIERVTINAAKAESNATISGTGEKELIEGLNKIEIVCTAQKGNSLTYVLNITRKELNPIIIKIGDKDYSIIRKPADLGELSSFSATTVTYEETEVPALSSDITNYTLLGVKDTDGNVLYYIYKDGKITDRYLELKNSNITISPIKLETNDKFNEYQVIRNKDLGVSVYALKEDSRTVIVYARDVTTGKFNYYLYDTKDKSFMIYDDEVMNHFNEKNEIYKYVIFGLLGIIIILVFVVIFKGKSKNTMISDKEEPKEVKSNKVEDVKEIETPTEVELTKKEKKQIIKETKKKEKAEKKKKDEFDF